MMSPAIPSMSSSSSSGALPPSALRADGASNAPTHVLDLATGETGAWTYTGGGLAGGLDGGDPDA